MRGTSVVGVCGGGGWDGVGWEFWYIVGLVLVVLVVVALVLVLVFGNITCPGAASNARCVRVGIGIGVGCWC